MPRKNPFLGFGRGGYFSTSRTYRLQHPSSKPKGKGRSSSKLNEEDEGEESKYGKYYERLSPADKAKVRSMMRNPSREYIRQWEGMKIYKVGPRQFMVPQMDSQTTFASVKEAMDYIEEVSKDYPENPGRGKGTVLVIKNPAPWFGSSKQSNLKYQVTIEGFSNNYVSSLAKAKAKLKSLVAANADAVNGAFFEIYRGNTRMYSGRVWKGGKLSYF